MKGLEELKVRHECEALQERVLLCPLDIIAGNDDTVHIIISHLKQQLESPDITQSIDQWHNQSITNNNSVTH